MKCNSCGAEVPNESTFCPDCGTRLVDNAASKDVAVSKQQFQDLVKSKQEDEIAAEEELWHGGYSGKAMYGTWLVGALISVGLIVAMVFFPPALVFLAIGIVGLWIVLGVMLAYRKLNVDYELTSQRFIHKRGVLKRTTDRIEVIDIDDVTYEQGIIQRMLGVGTIRISSSDRTHPELTLAGIDNVAQVANTIDDIRRQVRMRRGLHIEAI